MATQMSKKRKFVADGVFFAELNEVFTRELAEDGYSGVEVRVTPMRTEIIIRATRTQNVLGEKGRRIRELTSIVQKRFRFPENSVELYAEKVNNRGLCAIAQCESLRYKLLGGLAVRRYIIFKGVHLKMHIIVFVAGTLSVQSVNCFALLCFSYVSTCLCFWYSSPAPISIVMSSTKQIGYFLPTLCRKMTTAKACYGVLRFVMESGAKGCEVIISGKLRAQRAKSMKFKDGYMISSGQPVKEYIDAATRHVLLRQGVLGIKVKIMLDWDPKGKMGPQTPLPDLVTIHPPKEDDVFIRDPVPAPVMSEVEVVEPIVA
ncbi:hypothetical protein KSS87_004125 [Heliosperma pusillum]|nr:hypothetical protein KSS87_004125 [Heliosperma pusillum]